MILEAEIQSKEMVYLDGISFVLEDGSTIHVDWDTSEYIMKNGRVYSTHKGVYINEKYANGRLDIIKTISKIDEVRYYFDDDVEYSTGPDKIIALHFRDGENEFNLDLKVA